MISRGAAFAWPWPSKASFATLERTATSDLWFSHKVHFNYKVCLRSGSAWLSRMKITSFVKVCSVYCRRLMDMPLLIRARPMALKQPSKNFFSSKTSPVKSFRMHLSILEPRVRKPFAIARHLQSRAITCSSLMLMTSLVHPMSKPQNKN